MERPHFDVLREPWIPVVALNGEHYELGILDTLLRAPELKEISDASPMVEFGLYRLLSVFLMDLYRPKTRGDIWKLLKQGCFREADLQTYLQECAQDGASFDLFDEKRPFLQTPYVREWDKDPKPVAVINKTIPSGSNHTHFDHRDIKEIQFSFAEAARQLVPLQLFAIADGSGYRLGINGNPPYYIIIRRETLFDTLIYLMLPEEKLPNHLHFTLDTNGQPIPVRWRNSAVVARGTEIITTSFLDGMLFMARRILLIPDKEKQRVCKVYRKPGLTYCKESHWTDPSVAYEMTNKGRWALCPAIKKDGQSEFELNIGPKKKSIWMNLYSMINTKNQSAPSLLQNAKDLDRDSLYFDLMVYGLSTRPGKSICLDTMKYDLRIPTALMDDEERIGAIQFNIQKASEVAECIWNGFHEKNGKKTIWAIPEIPPKIIQELIKRLTLREELEFWHINRELVQDTAATQDLQRQWCHSIVRLAKEEIRNMECACNLRGSALAKLAEKESMIFSRLKKIEEDFHL